MVAMRPTETKKRWIVVADEAVAEFYEQEKKYSPARMTFMMNNDAARQKTDDLITDRGGRSFDSFGAGRHTMAREKTDPKTQEAKVFAKLIAGRIVAAVHSGEIRDFGLIAAPRFLGLLRKALAVAHGIEPCLTVAKQVVGQDVAVIDRLLAEL
jgi:protein required for attachment to host cells